MSNDKREDDLYDDLIEDLGIKKRGWFIWCFDWRFWDQKREDDLYDELIEDFGTKKERMICMMIWLKILGF